MDFSRLWSSDFYIGIGEFHAVVDPGGTGSLHSDYTVARCSSVCLSHAARVGPGHCCYRIGPIRFLARWRKRRS